MSAKQRYLIGITLLILSIVFFLSVAIFSPYDPTATDLPQKNLPPSTDHLFGTDDLGRDLLIRTAEGAAVSLLVGLLAFFIDLFVGGTVGILTALAPPSLEIILTRAIEIIYSLPYLLGVILISVYTGSGLCPVLCALLCIGWIHMSKISYQMTKSASVEGWSLAAQALGVSKQRLVLHHILPNIGHTLLGAALIGVPQAIFTEAFLSFLGVGIQPPLASLGSMIADSLAAMRYFPWRILFPSCTLAILIFAITLIQEAVRDLYDPKGKPLHE